MDIIDIERKAHDDAKKDVLIFNPLPEDVQCTYGGDQYLIPSKENKSFKTPVANHMGEFLMNLYINTKEKNYPPEKARKLIFPE
jgi:hypothetical protein